MKNYKKTRQYLIEKVKKKQSEKRHEHTLRVEKTAIKLAKIYGGDTQKVSIAAILHDNAKNLSDEKKLKLVKKYGISLSLAEEANIDLVHAKLGSVIARKKYDIDDVDILNAIMFHTTGRPGMTLTEKIIYVADFVEPGRQEFPGMLKARKLAYEDLDLALIKILMLTINHIIDKDKIIDETTEKTYEYYYKIIQNKNNEKRK